MIDIRPDGIERILIYGGVGTIMKESTVGRDGNGHENKYYLNNSLTGSEFGQLNNYQVKGMLRMPK